MAGEDLDQYLVRLPRVTQAQCDALATVSANLSPYQLLEIKQTWTSSGGTHLYALKSNGESYHIARNGKIQKMGVADAAIRT